jgi:hypothetical protein
MNRQEHDRMPAMTYPEGTPAESRWDWYFRVPDAWRAYAPDKIIRYAQYLLTFHGLTNDGAPAELATQEANGDWFFLVKSDIDPAEVIDLNNLPAFPETAREIRIRRLTAAQTLLAAGTPLTNAQVQEALKHLIDGYLDAGR